MGIEGIHKDEISQRQGADWEKIGTNIGRGTSNDWGKGEPRESSVAKAYIGESFQGKWALSHANHLELETTCLGDIAHDRDWSDTYKVVWLLRRQILFSGGDTISAVVVRWRAKQYGTRSSE